MQLSGLSSTPNRVFDFICLWILPAGYFLLLCSMFFLPDRSLLHKLYYGLFSIPTLIALCLRPRELRELLRDPIFVAVLLFAAWALISLAWSPGDDGFAGKLKPPLHLLMLFAGCYLLIRHRSEVIQPLLFSAAIVGLILYCTLLAISVVINVGAMNQGARGSGFGGIGIGIIDIIIVAVLVQAIQAGAKHRKLLRQQAGM